MRRIESFYLCMTVVLATCAISVAAASAAPEHIFRVEGRKLEANEKMKIIAKAKTEIKIKGELEFLGTKVDWIVKCKKFKLGPAINPMVTGGIPGTSENEGFEFEECATTIGGAKCENVVIEAFKTNDELVTILKPAAKVGKLADWFVPAEGVFARIKLIKCGIFGNPVVTVEGSTAALVNPEKVLAAAQTLVWSEAERIIEVERQTGEKVAVGLRGNGLPVTINGEIEVELVSKEKWGGF